MTSMIRRLALILKSWWYGLMSSAEDPRRVYADVFDRQEQLLAKVRDARSGVAASKEYLTKKAEEVRSKLPRLDSQAREALTAGREEVARLALRLRYAAQDELKGLEGQADELGQEQWMLMLVEQRLKAQIDTFYARQMAIAAQHATAEAQVSVHEALGGLSDEMTSLGLALERAEQRTEDMQARVSAIEGLVELGVLESPADVAAHPALLLTPAVSADVEDQLDELKQEMGLF